MRVPGKARAAPAADHAKAMRVVRHQPGVVFIRQRIEFAERRQIAVHGEYAIGHDQQIFMRGAMLGEPSRHVPASLLRRERLTVIVDDAAAPAPVGR